ncbi:uncharacterized protein MEPE_04399 [Melanopsichium pennsylvanicum]|uniref:Uncharacterized protein n=1 Tax=Melanopsichium pennsylvanicum TaxID=63383 RepID=A0AAJ4XNS0_9BASI|nr:uncharacterized protein MEPE_04399 [Melanopsichium pennsylvanicum]
MGLTLLFYANYPVKEDDGTHAGRARAPTYLRVPGTASIPVPSLMGRPDRADTTLRPSTLFRPTEPVIQEQLFHVNAAAEFQRRTERLVNAKNAIMTHNRVKIKPEVVQLLETDFKEWNFPQDYQFRHSTKENEDIAKHNTALLGSLESVLMHVASKSL